MITVKRKIAITSSARGKHLVRLTNEAPPPPPPPAPATTGGSVPRVTRLLALALRCERMVRSGEVRDQSELARRCGVTQPRMTQIMNLALLSPALQEQVLTLPRVTNGRAAVNERMLRGIAREPCWIRQQEMWNRVVGNVVDNHEEDPNRFRA